MTLSSWTGSLSVRTEDLLRWDYTASTTSPICAGRQASDDRTRPFALMVCCEGPVKGAERGQALLLCRYQR